MTVVLPALVRLDAGHIDAKGGAVRSGWSSARKSSPIGGRSPIETQANEGPDR
jgi:hypothetical protein